MKILKIITFIILLVLVFYIIFVLFFKKEVVAPDKDLNTSEQNQIFHGPVGEPYVKGPTSPPSDN
jgi:flagellar basal body-associated protein FliL